MLDFCRSNDAGNNVVTKLLRRCPASRSQDNQNPTLPQRVPAGHMLIKQKNLSPLRNLTLATFFQIVNSVLNEGNSTDPPFCI